MVSVLDTLKQAEVAVTVVSYLGEEENSVLLNQVKYHQQADYTLFSDYDLAIVAQDTLLIPPEAMCLSGDHALLSKVHSLDPDTLLVFVLNADYKGLKSLYQEYHLDQHSHCYYQITDIDFPRLTSNVPAIQKESYDYHIALHKDNTNKELRYWFNT